MTKPNENWQERSYEAFTPNVKLDCNNPQEGFSGPIVYNMLASSKDGNQSSYGMTEGGLFHIYNDQCIEIVGGKKVGGGGVCLNIVGSSGDVWITALSNGDVRVTGTNIMLDAAKDLRKARSLKNELKNLEKGILQKTLDFSGAQKQGITKKRLELEKLRRQGK